MSSRQIQLRRGTADEHTNFVGAVGELTMDTTNNTLHLHDGKTLGGIEMARMTDIPTNQMPSDADYVIETQLPTSDNNYTWYRKYKSGWVEQGGYVSGTDLVNIPLPIALKFIAAFSRGASLLSGSAPANHNTIGNVMGDATISSVNFAGGGYWRVCGIA